jgi:hypothetical protein
MLKMGDSLYDNLDFNANDDAYFLRLFSDYDHTCGKFEKLEYGNKDLFGFSLIRNKFDLNNVIGNGSDIQKILRLKKWAEIKLNFIIVIILIVISLHNYIYIFKGYYYNYSLRSENVKILTKNSERINQGRSISKIILNKYDLMFAESDPWGGAAFQQIWMHNYYNIPQRIKIIYIINKVVQPF